MISIGRAPNLAAKFSDIRTGTYSTFVSSTVYSRMKQDCKERLNGTKDIWQKQSWNFWAKILVITEHHTGESQIHPDENG